MCSKLVHYCNFISVSILSIIIIIIIIIVPENLGIFEIGSQSPIECNFSHFVVLRIQNQKGPLSVPYNSIRPRKLHNGSLFIIGTLRRSTSKCCRLSRQRNFSDKIISKICDIDGSFSTDSQTSNTIEFDIEPDAILIPFFHRPSKQRNTSISILRIENASETYKKPFVFCIYRDTRWITKCCRVPNLSVISQTEFPASSDEATWCYFHSHKRTDFYRHEANFFY